MGKLGGKPGSQTFPPNFPPSSEKTGKPAGAPPGAGAPAPPYSHPVPSTECQQKVGAPSRRAGRRAPLRAQGRPPRPTVTQHRNWIFKSYEKYGASRRGRPAGAPPGAGAPAPPYSHPLLSTECQQKVGAPLSTGRPAGAPPGAGAPAPPYSHPLLSTEFQQKVGAPLPTGRPAGTPPGAGAPAPPYSCALPVKPSELGRRSR